MRWITRSLALFAIVWSITGSAQDKSVKKDMGNDGEDPAAVSPTLIRGPYLQQASGNSILIRWRTDALSRSRVRFGTVASPLDQVADDSALVTEHKVLLRALQPMTRYYYAVGSIRETLQGDSANYFYTLPAVSADQKTLRIAAFGDCGNNSINQRQVRDHLLDYLGEQHLHAWLLLGDNTYPDGTDAEFQTNFFNIYKDKLLKQVPLFPCPGNHDYHDVDYSAAVAQQTHTIAYYQNFSTPEDGQSGGVPSHTGSYYSYDIGNIHFLSLDSYGKEDNTRLSDTSGPQARWVKADLQKAASAEWIVAYWHHPPYTMGSHSSDKEKELVDIREQFLPLLEQYGVDLVLCGHSHDYERSNLMNGFYGPEMYFDSSHYTHGRISAAPTVFRKKSLREKGTVYVVSGSAGKLGGTQPSFPHAAMAFSDADHGGVSLIEVTGHRLEFKWVCADGLIRDRFSIIKP